MHNRIQTGGLAMALLAGLGSSSGFGAVLSVTSTNDNDAGSLRQAISRAAPGDTVEFAVRGGITLTNGELFITKDLTINGPGAANLFINGNAQSRVFHINSNITASISGLTITNGLSPAGTNNSVANGRAGVGAPGGGVFNEGTLTLQLCQVIGNSAGKGGDDFQSFDDNVDIGGSSKGGGGGGIGNTGVLSLFDCRVENNVAGVGGGATNSDFIVKLQGNPVGNGGDGGGIYNTGALVVSNSVVSNNQGGLAAYACSRGGAAGGLYSEGNVRIYNSTFDGNTAGSAGGFGFPYTSGNLGGYGGGICNHGDLGIVSSTFINNRGGTGGPGYTSSSVFFSFVTPGGAGGSGAGICNYGSIGMTNCTVANNISGNGGKGAVGYFSVAQGGNGGYGGGVCNFGQIDLVNCTVSMNAVGFQGAGASWSPNLTAYGSDGFGGGIYTEAGWVRVFNTLIAGNSASTNIVSSDVCGNFISLGNNLVGIATTNGFIAGGDITGNASAPADARMASLADNGGLTRTCVLMAGSPAIDAGNDAVLSNPWSVSTDQRGRNRKSGSHVDIGAYEYENETPQFSLTIITNGHGTVSITPILASYASNTVVTVIATPATNAVFSQWTGTLTSSSQTNTIVFTTNVVLQANFLDLVPVTATTLGGGSIYTGSTSNVFVQGTTASLVATPSNGWQFICWAGDVSGTNTTLTFVVDKPASVQAVFGTPVIVAVNGNGMAYPVPSLALYPFGTTVQLYEAPSLGTAFGGWETVEDLNTNTPVSFVITNPEPSVLAHFDTLPAGRRWTVTATNDSGPGSLRQAVLDAQDNDTITVAVSGVITLSGSEIVVNKNIAIEGPGASALAISGNGVVRVLTIQTNASVSVSGLTITNGFAGSSDNLAGGGILNFGTLRLRECVIIGNQASGGRGDVLISWNGGSGGDGGGIANYGVLELDASLAAANQSGPGGSAISGAEGSGGAGGNGGGIYSAGVMFAKNTTVTGNKTGNGGDAYSFYNGSPGGNGGWGAGICSLGTIQLVNCTVSGNSTGIGGAPGWSKWLNASGAPGVGGYAGGLYVSTNLSELINTLIVSNTVPAGGGARDAMGAITSLGHNLIAALDRHATISPASGDVLGTTNQPVDAKLAALADNGGPTMTCALLPGSPAIDAGDDAALSDPWNLTTDQRGYPRKSGTHVDIGAFELTNPDASFHLDVSFSAPAQALRLNITGTAGKRLDVLTSTNLVHWTRLTSVTNDTGTVSLTQPLNSGSAVQFFRAQELP